MGAKKRRLLLLGAVNEKSVEVRRRTAEGVAGQWFVLAKQRRHFRQRVSRRCSVQERHPRASANEVLDSLALLFCRCVLDLGFDDRKSGRQPLQAGRRLGSDREDISSARAIRAAKVAPNVV